MKTFEIITLFPEAFPGTLGLSIFKKSRGTLWDIKTHDLRQFGIGKHKNVDDDLFGGTPGMLIRPDVIDNAMQSIQMKGSSKKIFMSPRGKLLNQTHIEEYAKCNEDILILCGRYEGVDQRAIEHFNFEEISIGNYILAGGEVAAIAMMEGIIRKIPGVIGNENAFIHETFSNSEISEPRFTRPAIWQTHSGQCIAVDETLTSGNHKLIELFQKCGRKSINKVE